MLSFNNNPKIKEQYIGIARYHRDADNFRQGHGYCRDGKVCALGCYHGTKTQKDCIDKNREIFGIPESLSFLEEIIFEKSSFSFAKEWPLRFIEAIPVGVDLSKIENQIKKFILEVVLKSIYFQPVNKCIRDVILLLDIEISGNKVSDDMWSAARSAAASAADSVESAAWSAEAAARSDVESAADSAAWFAESAELEKIGDKLLSLFVELEPKISTSLTLGERLEILEESVEQLQHNTATHPEHVET